MNKSEKQKAKENERRQRILDTAFRIFVEKKIEAVSMGEIAEAVGIGRATLFRCYSNKTELAIAVCMAQWKSYLDELDRNRPISSVQDIPAIDRFIFTLDSYIEMYLNHKGVDPEQFENIHTSVYSADTRLHMMYEKAKEDHTFRTDIPEDEFIRVTVHTMMAACTYYAGGFIWGAEDNRDYMPELIRLKEMIINYATASV